jgi:hypothetical protein
VKFRDDILRGVRLFLIAFAAILTCIAAYRMFHSAADAATVQESPSLPDVTPTEDPATVTPVKVASSDTPGVVVPPPPPVDGDRPKHVVRAKTEVPPPPPLTASTAVRAKRTPQPSGRDFEVSEPGTLPAPRVEESPDSAPSAPKKGIGYKSLLEADPTHSGLEPIVPEQKAETVEDKPKGNRFFRAVGKIFRPGGKKEPAAQPKP